MLPRRVADLLVELLVGRRVGLPRRLAVVVGILEQVVLDVGLHAAAGRAFGPLRLAGEYTLGDASADRAVAVGGAVGVMADCGQRQRLGVAARYRVDLGLPTMGTGAYVEAGVGRATTAWKSGVTSTRDDMLLGVGFELLGGDARVVGMDLGMRVTIAEPEQPGAAKDTTGVITVGLLLGG